MPNQMFLNKKDDKYKQKNCKDDHDNGKNDDDDDDDDDDDIEIIEKER